MRICERSPVKTWFNIWQLHHDGKLPLYSQKKLDFEGTLSEGSRHEMVKRLSYPEAIKPHILGCKKGAERGLVSYIRLHKKTSPKGSTCAECSRRSHKTLTCTSFVLRKRGALKTFSAHIASIFCLPLGKETEK